MLTDKSCRGCNTANMGLVYNSGILYYKIASQLNKSLNAILKFNWVTKGFGEVSAKKFMRHQ